MPVLTLGMKIPWCYCTSHNYVIVVPYNIPLFTQVILTNLRDLSDRLRLANQHAQRNTPLFRLPVLFVSSEPFPHFSYLAYQVLIVHESETERCPERSCRINTQGSLLALKRRLSSTTTKSRVAYGNSHLACV